MFHISFELLDTVLTYTKYREYNFLNKKFSLFNALQFKFEVCKKINETKKTNEIY